MARIVDAGPDEAYPKQLLHRKRDIGHIISDQVAQNVGSADTNLHRDARALEPLKAELVKIFALDDANAALPNLADKHTLKLIRKEVVTAANKYVAPSLFKAEAVGNFANDLLGAVAVRMGNPNIELPEVPVSFEEPAVAVTRADRAPVFRERPEFSSPKPLMERAKAKNRTPDEGHSF